MSFLQNATKKGGLSVKKREVPVAKKQKKGVAHYYCCKNARAHDDIDCQAVMCSGCYDKKWQTTLGSDGNNLSIEEEDEKEKAEEYAADNVGQRANYKKGGKKVQSKVRGVPSRVSQRGVRIAMSDNCAMNHEEDENGCRHDDKKFWQFEGDWVYLSKKYREKKIMAGKKCQLVDTICCICADSITGEIGCDM